MVANLWVDLSHFIFRLLNRLHQLNVWPNLCTPLSDSANPTTLWNKSEVTSLFHHSWFRQWYRVKIQSNGNLDVKVKMKDKLSHQTWTAHHSHREREGADLTLDPGRDSFTSKRGCKRNTRSKRKELERSNVKSLHTCLICTSSNLMWNSNLRIWEVDLHFEDADWLH